MTPLEQRSLQVAKRYVGAREDQGANRGRVIQRFQLFIGRWMIGQPWCVAFAVYCVHVAAKELGIKTIIPKTASSTFLYEWARKNGMILRRPVDGCIFVVRKGGKGDSDGRRDAGKSHTHTGLVHTVNRDGTLVTIEGNYGNRVAWNDERKIGDPLDYIRVM